MLRRSGRRRCGEPVPRGRASRSRRIASARIDSDVGERLGAPRTRPHPSASEAGPATHRNSLRRCVDPAFDGDDGKLATCGHVRFPFCAAALGGDEGFEGREPILRELGVLLDRLGGVTMAPASSERMWSRPCTVRRTRWARQSTDAPETALSEHGKSPATPVTRASASARRARRRDVSGRPSR